MDTARRLEIERVIHIGTDEVYGSVEVGSSKETDPLEPRSPYSASKAGSDLIALSYHHTYGLPVTVTRCTTTSGRTSTPRRRSRCSPPTCSTASSPALRRRAERARLAATSTTTAPACCWCCSTGALGEIYNIGAGNETPNRELVDKLLELLGRARRWSSTSRTGSVTTAATRSTSPRSPRSAGEAAHARRGAGGDGRLVPRQRVVVASRSRT